MKVVKLYDVRTDNEDSLFHRADKFSLEKTDEPKLNEYDAILDKGIYYLLKRVEYLKIESHFTENNIFNTPCCFINKEDAEIYYKERKKEWVDECKSTIENLSKLINE